MQDRSETPWSILKPHSTTFDHCFLDVFQGYQWDIEDLGPRLGFDIGVTGPPVGGGIKFISLHPQHDVIQLGGRRLSWLVHVGLLWFTWWMSSSMLTSRAPSGSHLLQGNAAPVPMQLKAMKALAAEEKWLIDSWCSIFQWDSRYVHLRYLRYLRFVWKTFLQILTDLISLWKVQLHIHSHLPSKTLRKFCKVTESDYLSPSGISE